MILWLMGTLLIASTGVALSMFPRIIKAWREGERGPFLRLLISTELHAIGVLVAAMGNILDSVVIIAAGLAMLLTSKQIWQLPGRSGEGRRVFIAQLAAIAAWTVWVFARGL